MRTEAQEMFDLKKADRDIADGEARVEAQIRLIQSLRDHGHDPSQAELVLINLRNSLQAWLKHRATIAATLKIIHREQAPTG